MANKPPTIICPPRVAHGAVRTKMRAARSSARKHWATVRQMATSGGRCRGCQSRLTFVQRRKWHGIVLCKACLAKAVSYQLGKGITF